MNTQSTFRTSFSQLGEPRQISGDESETTSIVPGKRILDDARAIAESSANRLGDLLSVNAANVIGPIASGDSEAGCQDIVERAGGIGFDPTRPRLHRIYNFLLASFLILLALPLIALISALLLVTQGTSIFYRGIRVGLEGRHFTIIKFRTLDSAKAAELTRDRVLPPDSDIETPLGYFLRETRLDELPQLFNVLVGDMNICGPRPVRPEIARELEGEITGYRDRFRVKPGLLGPTQAYMNHGTSKRIRARFNSKFLDHPVSYRSELGLIFLVGSCVFLRAGDKFWRVAKSVFTAGRKDAKSVDRAERFQVALETSDGVSAKVVSLADDQIVTQRPIAPGAARLHMTLPNGRKRVAGIVVDAAPTSSASSNEYRFVPSGEYSNHVLSRYFYERVVVPDSSRILFLSLGRDLRKRMLSFLPAFWRAAPHARVL